MDTFYPRLKNCLQETYVLENARSPNFSVFMCCATMEGGLVWWQMSQGANRDGNKSASG